MAPPRLVQQFIDLSSFQARLQKYHDSWLMAHGISFREFQLMHALHHAPEGRMKRIDLADTVGLSASGVTRLLNPMEKIGLVSKEAGARDARVSLVCLSETGAGVYRDALSSFSQRARQFLAGFEPPQLEALQVLAGMKI